MATEVQRADNSEQIPPSPSKESLKNQLFLAEDTLDEPCDVVLVVKGDKEFKAHRKILSEASPFFEKLLNSDMKESQEGVVRLEMFSESVMAATLEFIYTGHVEILNKDNARDLTVMADYLLLEKLKSLAEDVLLAEKLCISNCISTYFFSERYQCEEVLSKTKKFILANFTAVYPNPEDVLNMSKNEVEMWISSDEMDVSTEEDVFKFILAWIDHDKSKRKKYFAELFRHVRLVYVSRDFLSGDVVTSDLVKNNEGCLDLVKDAMNFIDSKNRDYLSAPPRKSLETAAVVMRVGADLQCYFPGENTWCRLGEIPSEFDDIKCDKLFPCAGKLYSAREAQNTLRMIRYSPYGNSWMQLPPLESRHLLQIFVRNEDEMYALFCGRRRGLFISKYKPESHSWEDISTDHFHPIPNAPGSCIVASDHFLYFIGGLQVVDRRGSGTELVCMSDVYRYDFSKGQWDKVANIHKARSEACGAAANGRIFIAGGRCEDLEWLYHSCEMYDETTNEWQFIASIKKPEAFNTLLAADGKLYAVSCEIQSLTSSTRGSGYLKQIRHISVERYNPKKNKWKVKSEVKDVQAKLTRPTPCYPCSMRIFQRILQDLSRGDQNTRKPHLLKLLPRRLRPLTRTGSAKANM